MQRIVFRGDDERTEPGGGSDSAAAVTVGRHVTLVFPASAASTSRRWPGSRRSFAMATRRFPATFPRARPKSPPRCCHHRYATARVEPAGHHVRGPRRRRRCHRGDGSVRRYPYPALGRCARDGLPARRRGAACRRRGGRRRRPAVSHGHREPQGGPRAHPFREPAGVRRVERRDAARRRTRKARRRNRAARAQDATSARTIPADDRDVVRVADLQTTAERGVRTLIRYSTRTSVSPRSAGRSAVGSTGPSGRSRRSPRPPWRRSSRSRPMSSGRCGRATRTRSTRRDSTR